MSLNDFENVDFDPKVDGFDVVDADDNRLSAMGAAVSNAIESKDNVYASMGAALDAASEFGYQLGVIDKKAEVVEMFLETLEGMDDSQVEEMEALLNLLAKINVPTGEEPNVETE